MRSVVAGKSYDIEIALPAAHTRGTYWYHPHPHGSADVQVASGMAGAIIVEGDFADVPEISRAHERVMPLTQVVFDAFYMIEDFGTLFPETSTRFLGAPPPPGGQPLTASANPRKPGRSIAGPFAG